MQVGVTHTPSLKHSNPYSITPLIELSHLPLLKRSNSQHGTDLLGNLSTNLLDINDEPPMNGFSNYYNNNNFNLGDGNYQSFFSQRGVGGLLDDIHPPNYIGSLPFASLAGGVPQS